MNRLRKAVERRDDRGTSLLEIVVAMSIMAVFLAMFAGSVSQIFGAANRTDAVSTAQAGANIAFAKLDKEVRYASGVSRPLQVGASGDWYVEYLTSNTGTPTCTELRLNGATNQLQRRSWVQDTGTPGAWTSVVSEVGAGPNGEPPFEFFDADATNNFQRLRINLVSTVGLGANSGSTHTDVTFTALNTSLSTESSIVCAEGRAIP